MRALSLSDQEFTKFQGLLFDIAGIYLAPAKKIMLAGRLQRRIRFHGLDSFGDYFQLLKQRKEELQVAVDLLTTNETYFFREPKHFEFLEKSILPSHPRGRLFRIWSAASSSGEEAYSLAMLMADCLGVSGSWEVVASDISMQVLEQARRGVYDLRRAELIPPTYKQQYCLRDIDDQEGMLLVNQALRQRVQFRQVNLNNTLPNDLGAFDLVLLRNVMIYFQLETKREVVRRIVEHVKPGAYLFVGHSESLHGFENGLQLIQPSIYRKPA